MEPLEIIAKYYKPRSRAYKILVVHSTLVTEKALKIAQNHTELLPDLAFIEEAAMLHDIGIFKTNAPDLFCFGEFPYLCHGYLGCEILKNEGFPEHGLVCERHTGVGITIEEIVTIEKGRATTTTVKLPKSVKNWTGGFLPMQVHDTWREITEHKPAGAIKNGG